jgi:hypothetical protein
MLLQKAQNQEIVGFNYLKKMCFHQRLATIHILVGSYLILIFSF